MIYGADNFTFKQADFYPFKDTKEIDRVRNITKEDIINMGGKHPTSPNMTVEVFKDEEANMVEIVDMVSRIVDSDRYDKKLVMIMFLNLRESIH